MVVPGSGKGGASISSIPVEELQSWHKTDEGLQVHRSHWVLKSAVGEIKRIGKLALITLTNGVEIPVSRNRMKDLKKAGWL